MNWTPRIEKKAQRCFEFYKFVGHLNSPVSKNYHLRNQRINLLKCGISITHIYMRRFEETKYSTLPIRYKQAD